jgi:hypothetical protein
MMREVIYFAFLPPSGGQLIAPKFGGVYSAAISGISWRIKIYALMTSFLFIVCSGAASAGEVPVTRIVGGGAAYGNGVVTLLRTITQQRATKRPLRILLSGTFRISQPIRLTAANAGISLEADPRRSATLVANGHTERGIEILGASDVHIAGLSLHGFTQDAIFAADTHSLTVERTIITETRSVRWSQGAIHLTGTALGATVRNNVVSGANYAGILVDTNHGSDVSGLRITGNEVRDTCRSVEDCGAIYVNDRGRRSRDILIANNWVSGFGPVAVGGRAIYLDDWASHVTVRGNRIDGPGQFAFQIHGGHDNLIEHNSVKMAGIAKAFLYQPAANGTRAQMTGNHLTDNVFFFGAGRDAMVIAASDIEGSGAVAAKNNRFCTPRCGSAR